MRCRVPPVDLVISLGVEPVLVPDVVNQAQATAEAAIVAATLTVGNVTIGVQRYGRWPVT